MPAETHAFSSRIVAMDELAQARSVALVPAVAKSYEAAMLVQRAAAGIDAPAAAAETIDAAYVRTHAVTVGLNRWGWSLRSQHAPSAATFALQAGVGVAGVAVDVLDADLARAQAWAAMLSIDVALVLSAALCTGLAVVSGDPRSNAPGRLPAFGPFPLPPS